MKAVTQNSVRGMVDSLTAESVRCATALQVSMWLERTDAAYVDKPVTMCEGCTCTNPSETKRARLL